MKSLVTAVAVALLGVGGAHATTISSGLRGYVTRGPIAPVCVAEQPCTEPARNVTLLFSRNDHVVGRAVTDGAGHYRVRLPVGVYAVRRPGSSVLGRKLSPNEVRVHARRFARVDFSIDTGIR
jgi:hypothetical protein